jgi:hypothetical protein
VRRVRRFRRAGAVWAPAALALAACQSLGPGPLVRQQDAGLTRAHLTRVAVAPFTPALGDETASEAGAAAAALVAATLAERLAGAGFAVIAPGDVEAAFLTRGEPAPGTDATAAARLTGELGATAVAVGRVTRFRERVGSAAGATVAASVAFEVSVHEVPGGRRLWTGLFDETQPALSANVLRARQFPGGGTRWLTAQEVARWGAEVTADAIAARPEEPAP